MYVANSGYHNLSGLNAILYEEMPNIDVPRELTQCVFVRIEKGFSISICNPVPPFTSVSVHEVVVSHLL